MNSNNLKVGDKIIFTNEDESRVIEVTQQLKDKYNGEMPLEYSDITIAKKSETKTDL